jgi:uncharacterized membrane protein YkoI
MRYGRWVGAVVGSTLMLGLVAGTGGPTALAAPGGAHARVRASARVRVRDHAAIMLAYALTRALRARGTVVLSMRAATRHGARGYVVVWARGRERGRLFVNARTGHTVRMRAQSASALQAGASLSAFLSALETTLQAEAGAPVSAQTEDNGAVMVFTLNIAGQTVTVTVNTAGQSTTGPTTAIEAPSVSMETAVDAALSTAGGLGMASLAGPYAVAAELSGWRTLYAQGNGGIGGNWRDQGSGLGLDFGLNLGIHMGEGMRRNFGGPAYVVMVDSSQGGQASVVESSQLASGATAPDLLAIDAHAGGQGSTGMAAPAITLDTAVTAATATDSGGIPVEAGLSQGQNGMTWQVLLLNQDGSLSEVSVDATTGAVLGTSTQGTGGPSGQGPSGDSQSGDN